MKKPTIIIYDIVLIALLASVLFVQEQLLAFLPNIQFTFLLIILYSKKMGLNKSALIVVIHVLLDSMFNSSFGVLYTLPMFLGYILIPITMNTVFKKVESHIMLAFLSIFFAVFYSLIFMINFVFILQVDSVAYLVADSIFQVLLASSSFLTILILYRPLSILFDEHINHRNIYKKQ
jgi:hypothetical protein